MGEVHRVERSDGGWQREVLARFERAQALIEHAQAPADNTDVTREPDPAP